VNAPLWPRFDRRTDAKVLAILHSGKVNYWTGPVGMEFERAFAKRLGFRNAVSVLSGFAARRVALLSLGLDPDAEDSCRYGTRKGLKVGTVGKVAFFTFGVGELITAGGQGGMVCTDDDDLAWEMRSIRDHGYDARLRMSAESKTANPYVHRRLGYNFRLTEIQSAIGLCELRRLRASSSCAL